MAEGDIEIARQYKLKPIDDVAAKLGLDREHLVHYGRYKAKLPLDVVRSLPARPDAKLVLVTALSAFHFALSRWRDAFSADSNKHSTQFFRIVNELPTLAMIAIVLLVVVKPF